MEQQMETEEVCEKVCVFEELLDIDFDYEFDVAKFFDFLRPETIDEVVESERWFHLAEGHPPSPLLLKLGLVTEELGRSATSSSKSGYQYAYSTTNHGGDSEVSSLDQWKKGPELMKSKSKSANQAGLSKSSRLLQPTASQLAKQNRQTGVRGTKTPARFEKLGSPLKTPGSIAATKRQKLEYGHLRKVAHLKHQTSFLHKKPRQVGSSNVSSSHARTKATVPKDPSLESANRSQRHRSKNAAELSRGSKYDSTSVRACPLNRKTLEPKKSTPSLAPQFQGARVNSVKSATQSGRVIETKSTNSMNASMHKEPDQMYKLRAHQPTKKSISSRGEIGVISSKRETTVPKEFKLSSSKKFSQNPPIELFSQLSLNSRKLSSVLENDQSLQTKNAKIFVGKSTRCCLKQSHIGGGRVTLIGC